jgi:OPA family glycerol-3-phosphate transporter-like MFS transporter/OPA family sugar phosphate sensor protein UhpC-like MFS transporter
MSTPDTTQTAQEHPPGGDNGKLFRQWQWRTIFGTMVGYAMFYFVRKNFSIAMATPEMGHELGWSNTQIGLILTVFNLLYGFARFGNGILADRINARKFMVTGLVCAAAVNLCVGFTSSIVMLGILWCCNAWFQAMGFPPCARLMTHWIPPSQLATKMSVWNVSHSVGAALVVVFCSQVVLPLCASGVIPAYMHPGWRWCFYLPAVIALIGAVGLWFTIRDTPSSVGLPELAVTKTTEASESRAEFRAYIRRHVFGNPVIWVLCVANFFVYIVRFGVLDWGPKLLKSSGDITLAHAGWMVAGFEIAGIIGMLAAGWATDRFFGGRGPRTCAICMGGSATFTLLFLWEWTGVDPNRYLAAAYLAGAGFFIYGPQALVGIASANIATKKAAATASGLTGTFGYASGLISGLFLGWLMDIGGEKGITYVLTALITFALIGMGVFLLAWRAKAHGYGDNK